jgi:5-methylcytosine-specific restriction endonuclease McrA
MITKDELRVRRDKFEHEKQEKQSDYRELEKLQQEFVSKFPQDRIPLLSLDDYVEGKLTKEGKINRDSFCYWVEVQTTKLGQIKGSNASKFGVFFDKETEHYKFTEKFKSFKSESAAFIFLRDEIVRLIEAGSTKNLDVIREIDISPMFKGKILSLYHPEKYLNIFSKAYIDYFLGKIGLSVPNGGTDVLDKRELLFAFKSNDEIMSKWTMYEYTNFLYEACGSPKKPSKIPEALRKYPTSELQALVNERVGLQNSAIDDIPSAPIGSEVPGRTPTAGSRYQRIESVRQFVIEQAKGTCEYCRKLGFPLPDGNRYLEAHHIIALAKQGPDTVDNVIALCPSDHREAHYGANREKLETEMKEIIKKRNPPRRSDHKSPA